MTKLILLFALLTLLAGCAAPRALVRDCRDAGPELLNCELVKKL